MSLSLADNHKQRRELVLSARGRPHDAARLLGAAAAGRRMTHRLRFRRDDPAFEEDAAAIRARLTPDAFRAAWAEGEAMALDAAVTYALEPAESLPSD